MAGSDGSVQVATVSSYIVLSLHKDTHLKRQTGVGIQLYQAFHPKSQGSSSSKKEFLFFFFFFLLIYSIRWVPFCNLHKDSFFVQRGPGHMLSAFFPPSLSFHLLQRGLNLPPWYRKGWSSSFPKVCTVLKNFKFIALSVGGLLLKFEMFALYHI